jgi:5-methylthioadenosine/S-adenosylhomocysteine deaminase
MTTLVLRGVVPFDLEVLRSGRMSSRTDIVVTDGVITSIGAADPAALPPDAEILDVTDQVVIPGLVNSHTHSNQTLEAGLADRLPLDAWMVVASYGGAGAALSPRELYVSSALGAIQMIRTGCTAVLDCARASHEVFAEGMDAIMQAYLDTGLRATVAAQFTDLDYFASVPLWLIGEDAPAATRRPSDEVLGPARAFVERWAGRSTRVQPCLGPSSLPRCSTELFGASVDLAQHLGCGLQTHLLSARSQVAYGDRHYVGSTVRFLEEIGALRPWASFAHAIWLSDDEVERFAAHDAVAVHNPVSNLKLGAGVAPVPALLAAGASVAIGADGASSNDTQNMFETLKMSALVHRVMSPPDRWPGAADALGMCWEGGARALRRPIGRIAPGCAGDLVVLDRDAYGASAPQQIANQLVYAELGGSVDTVVVDGRVLLRGKVVTSVDERELRAEARQIIDRLWSGLPDRLARFEELAPMLHRLEAAVGAMPLAFARCCG